VNPLRWLFHLLLEDDDTPPAPDDIVPLCELDELQAEIDRDVLGRNGIKVMLIPPKRAPPFWTPERTVQLHVFYGDFERARALLGLGGGEAESEGDDVVRETPEAGA
jgi:hypothetical protein